MSDPAAASSLLTGYPVVMRLSVQWGDMDSFQHVNNTIYFRWFESVRIDYTSRLGFAEMIREKRLGMILAAISCNFRKQVRFPDQVLIGARVARFGNSSFLMEHAVASEEQGALVADGSSTLVFFDYAANRPVRLPDEVRVAIRAVEGKPIPEA
jgi:acyl-CoA thioester hydrolase